MKHFLSLVYVAALALMLSTGASAREITVDGMVLKTNRTAKIATFTKLAKPSDAKWKNQVTIPATVTDGDVKCSVTKIDAGALYEHTTKAVSIPSTVTEIGSYAFYKTEFTEITLPSGSRLSVRAFSRIPNSRKSLSPRVSPQSATMHSVLPTLLK